MIRNLLHGPIGNATLRTSSVLGLRLLAQAGTLLILARALGPEQFGVFAGFAALAVLLGAISTGGTHLTLLRRLSRAPETDKALLPQTLGTTLLCSTVLIILYAAACHWLLPDTNIPRAVFYFIGIAELLIHPYLLIAAAERQARGEIARSQAIVIAPLIPRLVLAGSLLVTAPANPLIFYSGGYLLIHLLVAITVIVTTPTQWPSVARWKVLPRKQWLEHCSFAVAGLSNRAPTELDKTLSLQLLPLAAAGSYSAASRTMGAVITPVIALILSAQPRLFREHGKNTSGRSLRWQLLLATLGYGAFMGALMWISAPWIGRLFGPDYAHFEDMARVFALATPALGMRIASSNILMTQGSPWARVMIEALGVATLLLASIALTTQLPLLGLAVGYALSEWTMAVAGWALLWRKSHYERTSSQDADKDT